MHQAECHGVRPAVNALTIDVEDYFHPNAMDGVVAPAQWDGLPHRVEGNTLRLLDLLSEFVAYHGFAHRLVYRMGREQFRIDVARSRRVLEDCLGTRVVGFRAASYSIVTSTPWALDVLIDMGFEYDSRCSACGISPRAYAIVRLARCSWPQRVLSFVADVMQDGRIMIFDDSMK